MFGIDTTVLMIILLAAVSAGALAYAVLFPSIEVQKKTDARFNRVKVAETDGNVVKAARDRVNEATKRKKSVQESLKDLDAKQKSKANHSSPPLKIALQQAGWSISVPQFYMGSLVAGLLFSLVSLVMGAPIYIAAGMVVIAGLGVPRWILSFARKRRFKAFMEEFPNALDVMVRSIKSGLPVNDALRLIATDSQEPLRSEFRRIVEAQQMGLSIPEACTRLHQNIPVSETNFFAIVITIQSQAGGNLSEALGNLSRVLRERRKMKGKIKAMSMEAKASAAIIGALPFAIVILVYLTTPDYIITLFTDPRGNIILGASLIWMGMGVLVMKKMVNFDI
ncbi:MAG: type II secretion system F family protein [Rhizobiaceae bacterium]|nr:type II secretion system F family protein [Rhizobiaceae bacterium]